MGIQDKIAWIERKMKRITKKLESVKEDLAEDTADTGGWIELPTTMDTKVWNVRNSNPRAQPGPKTLDIIFPKNGYKSRQGVNHKCVLDDFPVTEAELEYEVYIEKDWDPVKGGKLPGFFIGKNGTGGKNYKKNDGSARIMWRRNGQLVGYLYLCTDQGKDVSKKQGKNFLDACDNHFPPAGIDVWRRTKDKVYLKKGTWNTVRMGLRLNDQGKANGRLWLEVNGTRLETNDVYYTENPSKNKIGGLQWSLWYGGGSSSWAPSKEQCMRFRNIRYRH